MLLAVNIQNHGIAIGCFAERRLCHRISLGADARRTADEYLLLLRLSAERHGFRLSDVDGVILASVVPSLSATFEQALREAIPGVPITVVGPGLRTGFAIRLDDPKELGADLAADIAGAVHRFGAPVLIADLGAVCVIAAVTAEGAYVGGALLPGIGQALHAMQAAELLPDVTVGDDVPLIGKSTEACMRAGVIRGQAAAIDGLLREYRQALALPENTPIVVSGVDAPKVIPYLSSAITHVPELALLGLLRLYEINAKRA